MARVIVRMSLNSDPTSAVRNAVAAQLTAAGLQNTGTGIWELDGQPLAQIAGALQQAIGLLANPQAVPNAHANARLDHLWIYVDQV